MSIKDDVVTSVSLHSVLDWLTIVYSTIGNAYLKLNDNAEISDDDLTEVIHACYTLQGWVSKNLVVLDPSGGTVSTPPSIDSCESAQGDRASCVTGGNQPQSFFVPVLPVL